MVRIYKEFSFEASHQLEEYQGDCANVHGHSYKLRVGLYGRPDPNRGPEEGFVMDFGKLKKTVNELFLKDWDHSFLARGDEKILPALEKLGSKIVYLGFRPTAENMCCHILWQMYINDMPVCSARLHETETSFAEARIEDLIASGGPSFYLDDKKSIDMSQTLPVSEIFGPTIQGEGMTIGKKALFLRTYGCDDKCSWCDTHYAWDGAEKPKMMSLSDICQSLEALSGGCHHIIITGGNPCIHKEAMGNLLKTLKERGYSFGLETQGTIIPPWLKLLENVTLSPKPPSSDNITKRDDVARFISELRILKIPYSIKIVVFDDEDFSYVKELYKCFEEDVWFIQPGNPGGDFDLGASVQRYTKLVKRVLDDSELGNIRVLPQLHTWLWGNEREV